MPAIVSAWSTDAAPTTLGEMGGGAVLAEKLKPTTEGKPLSLLPGKQHLAVGSALPSATTSATSTDDEHEFDEVSAASSSSDVDEMQQSTHTVRPAPTPRATFQLRFGPTRQRQPFAPQGHPLSESSLGVSSSVLPAELPRGVMSLSLGAPAKHGIEMKILACAAQGWQGIEIHIEDIRQKARAMHDLALASLPAHGASSPTASTPTLPDPSYSPTREEMIAAAQQIASLCTAASLRVICLEPFLHYPGMLPLSARDARVLGGDSELSLWFEMSDILGTDLIQVASTMFARSPSTGEVVATGDEARVVEDLRLLAEQGVEWERTHGRRKYFAYEAMCFGAFVTTWQQAWRQVQLVDRENFGMVLDTFQILAGGIVDPAVRGGLIEGWRGKLERELEELKEVFAGQDPRNRNKLFFCQLGDAKMPDDGSVLDERSPLFDSKVHGERAPTELGEDEMLTLFFPSEPKDGLVAVIPDVCFGGGDAGGFRGSIPADLPRRRGRRDRVSRVGQRRVFQHGHVVGQSAVPLPLGGEVRSGSRLDDGAACMRRRGEEHFASHL